MAVSKRFLVPAVSLTVSLELQAQSEEHFQKAEQASGECEDSNTYWGLDVGIENRGRHLMVLSLP
jgi:hypothetical protein